MNKIIQFISAAIIIALAVLTAICVDLKHKLDKTKLERDIAQANLKSYTEKAERLEESNYDISKKLTAALESIQSNDCGKEPVPEYLLTKQKQILNENKK